MALQLAQRVASRAALLEQQRREREREDMLGAKAAAEMAEQERASVRSTYRPQQQLPPLVRSAIS